MIQKVDIKPSVIERLFIILSIYPVARSEDKTLFEFQTICEECRSKVNFKVPLPDILAMDEELTWNDLLEPLNNVFMLNHSCKGSKENAS